ncbi:MAG TPA: CHAT domain-containing tetratricopeptide repeat protein [Bryobacteraceae bacterium]|nr:CHAT domain-containing tetratricopeptide repeat protein [Bryobacteraceae bacterium]
MLVAGDLPRAAAEASAGTARFERDRSSAGYWNLRFLQAEILDAQANRKAAEALLRDPVPALRGLDQVEVRRLIDLALIGYQPADQTAALLARARLSAKDPELVVRLKRAQGVIASRQGKIGDAQTAYQEAEALAARNGVPYQEAYALNDLCFSARALHRYEDSIAFGLRALSVAGPLGAHRIAAFAHGNLGSTYAWLGDFDAALDHQQQATRIFEQIGARSNLMIALGELGVLYDREEDLPKALENYQRAFNLARELGNDRDAARFAWNISLTSIKASQWDAAEEWNRRAEDILHHSGNNNPVPAVERNRARIAWGRGHVEEAAAICRQILAANPNEPFIRWESYYLLGLIDSVAKRYPQANRSFESALETIGQVRSELLDSSNRITLLSRLIPFYQAYVNTLVDENDDVRALRVVESSRARVLSERLGRKLESQQFPSPASFQQAAAATHAAILSFWVAPARSFAWLITPTGMERFQLPGSAEIAPLVTQYRNSVEHSLRDPIASGEAAGPALWHALLEKVAANIPKDMPLIVIPDGPLHRLNLETMVAPASAAVPRPHYWIEDVRIAVSPSITIAASHPRAAAQPAGRELLLIGSPDYRGTSYEALPNAAAEIRGIQSHFGGWTQTVYQGALASPTAYLQSNPSRFSLIHFAAHAEANYERPLESAVVLSPTPSRHSYKLMASEVTDIPIEASLVTISACRSAGTRAYAGEGLLGFAWAFLNAGARAVIAGLWDVSDVSTSHLMDRLYTGIAAGQEPTEALRDAKLSLLNGAPGFRKPFYWAPFQVYLGSAARPTAAPKDTHD